MRVVVTGATGNAGSSLVRLLSADPRIDSVLGIARRRPELELPKVDWATADVASDELVPLLRAADAVVHLAWLIQPSRDEATLRRVNVDGTLRVFRAVADAGVGALVHASSVGAYSPGPKDRAVAEDWPVDGVPTSFYARHKAEVERELDRFEREHAEIRVARLRPGLIFKRGAASGIRRLFAGPLFPGALVRRGLVPLVPDLRGLQFQCVHADDCASAYVECAVGEAHGAFNIAADPPLDLPAVARLLDARTVRIPRRAARTVVDALWRLHLQPTPPGWLDLALAVPLMDTSRARRELGWAPRWTAEEALHELVGGLRDAAGEETPPLAADAGGPLRAREVATGVGTREDPTKTRSDR